MDYRTLCLVGTLVTLPFGLGFALAPQPMLALYGMTPVGVALALMGRYFGVTLIAFAAAMWGFREIRPDGVQQTAARLLAAAELCGLLVSLQAVLAGTVNALGWSTVVIYGFFTVAWARLAMRRA